MWVWLWLRFLRTGVGQKNCLVPAAADLTCASAVRALIADATVQPAGAGGDAAVLRPGRELVAAGYALYSSAVMLVLSWGAGVHGFTLDAGTGGFVLTHPDMRVPERGTFASLKNAPHRAGISTLVCIKLATCHLGATYGCCVLISAEGLQNQWGSAEVLRADIFGQRRALLRLAGGFAAIYRRHPTRARPES